ncbi:MAG: DUF5689 domain-containing protein [Bacteroides sp.]|jgi:hypothetical protein|nr:DUF5689 domain-containing protein [Bacteroides sp.]
MKNTLRLLMNLVLTALLLFPLAIQAQDPVEMADLATLRSTGATDGTVYVVTGEVILTHQNGNRNQKYFQDATGAILVDDPAGIITTEYNEYDGIQGLTGTLSLYNQLLQFTPTADPGPAVSEDNVVVPLELTLAEVTPAHQAMLISVLGVTFGTPSAKNTFSPSTSYNIYDASGTGVVRTPNANAGLDYFGANIPEETIDMVALVGQYNTSMQLMPRSLADMGITEMPNIAALRNQAVDGTTVYTLGNEVILTHQNGNRNQKYFQDATAAIVIDDPAGIITTAYNEYDGVTGLSGTLSVYNQLLQFTPVADPGPATSTDNVIEPLEVQLADITPDHQAQLIIVRNVTFDTPTNPNFAPSTSYDISDASGPGILRTPGSNAALDYFGTPVPTTNRDLIALVNQFNATMQIMPRSLDDFISLDFYDLTFNVVDENGDPLANAVITLNEQAYAAGEYVFADLPGGAYNYTVTLDGYWEKTGIVLLEADATEEVMLVAVDANLITEFPWLESFDTFLPEGWNTYYPEGDGEWVAGGDGAYHAFVQTGMAKSWLVTPQIQLPEVEPGGQAMLLSFLERNQYMDDYGYSGVWISTGSGLPENGHFAELYESNAPLSAYTEKVFNLEDYAGQVIYIAFVYEGEDAHNWWVDEVSIAEAPAVVEVPDIASLIEQGVGDQAYRITGEVVITHQQLAYRGQIFIQDASGATMIDDPDGIIETAYDNYDGITGLVCKVAAFQNMFQLVPQEDPGPASSTGNTVEPLELTLADLTVDHQAMLVLVREVSFDEGNEPTWLQNVSYYISDASGDGEIRTPNAEGALDYFGTDVPTTPKDIIAVVTQRYEDTRLLPRSLTDFMEPSTAIEETETLGMRLFPNPAGNTFTVESPEQIDLIRVYDLSGRLLMEQPVNDFRITLNTSVLRNGIYLVQVVAGSQTRVQKLQVSR